jgi:hypothetical protein
MSQSNSTKRDVLLIGFAHHYKIVMFGKTNFSGCLVRNEHYSCAATKARLRLAESLF